MMKKFRQSKNKSAIGIRFENLLRNHLESNGAFCMRSAASHSKVDLFCISNGSILLIQCKATKSDKLPLSIRSNKEFMELAAIPIGPYCNKFVFFYSYALECIRVFYWEETSKKWSKLDQDYILKK